jgi:hypothetical protein
MTTTFPLDWMQMQMRSHQRNRILMKTHEEKKSEGDDDAVGHVHVCTVRLDTLLVRYVDYCTRYCTTTEDTVD